MRFQGDELVVLLRWCNSIFTIRRHVDSVPMTTTDTVIYKHKTRGMSLATISISPNSSTRH
jgi:hypothetical protein